MDYTALQTALLSEANSAIGVGIAVGTVIFGATLAWSIIHRFKR